MGNVILQDNEIEMKVQTFNQPDLDKTIIVIEFQSLERLDWDVIKQVVEKQLLWERGK